MGTVQLLAAIAEIVTELIHFEPEVCICSGNELEFKGESVSVMRDFLPAFPQIWINSLLAAQFCICICNWNLTAHSKSICL